MIASLSISPECQRKAISSIGRAPPPRIWKIRSGNPL
jgi:hypothetical protein